MEVITGEKLWDLFTNQYCISNVNPVSWATLFVSKLFQIFNTRKAKAPSKMPVVLYKNELV